jgi:hypothetical protein
LEPKEVYLSNLTETLRQSQRYMTIGFGASLFFALLVFAASLEVKDVRAPIGPVEVLKFTAVSNSPPRQVACWNSGNTHNRRLARERAEARTAWTEKHNEWIAKVSGGKHLFAKKSSHFIQLQEPIMVINAIREIVTG